MKTKYFLTALFIILFQMGAQAGITLTAPTIKKEKKKGDDGREHVVFCVCVFVENDGAKDVKGDVSFWATAPGVTTPIRAVLCTKSDVTISKKKITAHGEAKGREEVCCCATEGIIEVANGRGHIMAAWGKKNDKGEVTIDKAEETKQTGKPIKLP
jgi:predicted ThiF/HesA family dinucleotide-utilizing enzyme